ncbi:MAG TPA: zinc-regulated TonB-dependent outer membrane receptor, partial [Candidatus Paceibacterota bacterium]|nr:zinc-regulated TonB-dependent outer membrane receptor [Candidatus Paceibacterota bacterium]
TLTDWGFYSQVCWGFAPGWVAALRGDYVTRTEQATYERINGDDPNRLPRWRVSPNLTWYPSEFSKVRLQYNYDDRDRIGVDHSVWLQFEFLLGAHSAHKF